MSIHFFESELDMPAKMVILPVRSTVIATSRGVVIISPIKFTPGQFAQIESLGKVTDIIAPSLWHHLYLPKTAERFHDATIWGPKGCKEKRPDIMWDKILGHDLWAHQNDIEMIPLHGMPNVNEVVFFDKATRSLIATDLVFNLQRPKGWASAIVLGLAGTYKKFGVSRILVNAVKDRAAFSESVKKIFSWDFDQIVMGHGDILVADGKIKLKNAFNERGFSF